MSDYIKREDALNALREYPVTKLKTAIRRLPSADVAPVVRCKDCKHRDPEDKRCDCGHAIQWQLPRDDDWFCADGDRKDDDKSCDTCKHNDKGWDDAICDGCTTADSRWERKDDE